MDFDEATKVLAVRIDFTPGTRFAISGHEGVHPVHDTVSKTYRHLNFFRVLFVTEGRGAKTIKALATDLQDHGCPPEQITSVSIDMSPAFIKGVSEHLPNARITFDKFHVIAHANEAVNKMWRIEQRTDKSLKGMRWSLLKDRSRLKPEAVADLDALIAKMTTVRTARAWVYKERLREILERKQINVVRNMLLHWCTCVMRSKVEPMKEVASMVRRHLEGIVAWVLQKSGSNR